MDKELREQITFVRNEIDNLSLSSDPLIIAKWHLQRTLEAKISEHEKYCDWCEEDEDGNDVPCDELNKIMSQLQQLKDG